QDPAGVGAAHGTLAERAHPLRHPRLQRGAGRRACVRGDRRSRRDGALDRHLVHRDAARRRRLAHAVDARRSARLPGQRRCRRRCGAVGALHGRSRDRDAARHAPAGRSRASARAPPRGRQGAREWRDGPAGVRRRLRAVRAEPGQMDCDAAGSHRASRGGGPLRCARHRRFARAHRRARSLADRRALRALGSVHARAREPAPADASARLQVGERRVVGRADARATDAEAGRGAGPRGAARRGSHCVSAAVGRARARGASMNPNPLIGVVLHWLGGLSSASFYVPYKRVQRWSWEIFWLTGGVFSWVIAPWLFALMQTKDLFNVLASTPSSILFWCWFWGAMWGLGGLTFGLVMRYLGLSLGMAVALALTTVIGTLGPPIFHGTIGAIAASSAGQITLLGVLITLIGMVVVAQAGRRKESEVAAEQIKQGVAEFNLRKGLAIAVFSGVMSGCFAWGLSAGEPIRAATLQAGTSALW